MPNETLARRYAEAVYALAGERNVVRDVQRDLHTFADALARDEEIRRFYRSPVVDRREKQKIVTDAFSRLDEVALHTILLLIQKRRESLLEEIVRQYDILEREGRGAQPLHVTTSAPLDRGELDALVAKLEARYGTRFDVTTSVDSHLIGGIRLTMGDRAVDGSVAGRLDDLARLLSHN